MSELLKKWYKYLTETILVTQANATKTLNDKLWEESSKTILFRSFSKRGQINAWTYFVGYCFSQIRCGRSFRLHWNGYLNMLTMMGGVGAAQ